MDKEHLITVSGAGTSRQFGMFTVTFARSEHVGSHSVLQRVVKGEISQPLQTPAHFSRFKCGEVYALHIAHPDGNIVVTTTAGARAGQLQGKRADVIFLGVGLLAREPADQQDLYWQETVDTVNPRTIIPVHWDNFTRQLSRGLEPIPRLADDIRTAMDLVKTRACGREVRVMDLRDSFLLRNGVIQ